MGFCDIGTFEGNKIEILMFCFLDNYKIQKNLGNSLKNIYQIIN